jgi:hypothetical protein
MYLTACAWCNTLVQVAEKPAPNQDTVCSEICKEAETRFRRMNTDEQIGLRNYTEHGVNPNHRGRKKA